MAKCKYCGQNISRLDKEICPFCGGKKPLDGTDTTTQDITKVLGQIIDPKKIKHCNRIVAAILAFVLGIFGAHSHYLKKHKVGFIILAVSVVTIGGLGSLLGLALHMGVWGYLIPYFVLEAFMIVVGINYLVRHDVTDGDGEFLD